MSKAELNVLERRLKPIYDALDSHNYKKSIQECDKVVKKHPNTPAAKVLKALTFVRLDRLQDATEILDVLDVPGVKHDELTLQAFVHCYRDSNQPAKITSLYEKTIAVDPSESNLTHLFMAYSKEGKYKEQQKIGLRLFKEYGNTPYYYWSVMSIIMQAQEDPELGKKMLYPLADKMFQTQIKKTGYTEGSSAETELKLLILEGQEKWAECAEFMEKPDASRLPLAPHNLVERGVEYMIKDEQWSKVDEVATKALENLSDNWNLWSIIVDSAVIQIQKLLQDPETAENVENAKNHVKRLAELVEEHQKKAEWKCRGPYLVPFMAIEKFQKMEKKIPDFELPEIFGNVVEKIMQYVEKFYTKPVCYGDVEMSFKVLDAELKTKFLKRLQEWIRVISSEDDKEGDESKVWAIILVERCRRALGDYEKLDAPAHRSLFQQCIAQIAAPGRSEHAQGVLANLTCAHLWEAYRKDNDLNKFYEMLLLLEYVATSNKTDPVCKLVLIRAYADLCNTGRITALLKVLDVKAIQLDTLGHLTFPVYEISGRFNIAIITNTQLSMMYDAAEREVQDCIAQAYRSGKFSAIPKMTAVSQQMKLSAQKSACEVLNRYLSGLFVLDDMDQVIVTLWGHEDPIGEKRIDWKSLVDTRDFNAIPYTETEDYEVLLEDMRKRTFKELLDISELRSNMCRALGALGRCSYYTEEADEKQFRLTRVQLKMCVLEYKKHLEYCVNEYPSFLIPSKLPQSPAPHHLSQWVHSGGPQMVLEYLEAAVKLVEILDSGEHPSVDLVGNRTEMAKKLINLIDVQPKRTEGEKLPPFWVVDPIIRSSRALQTIATVQVALRLIEKCVIKLAKNVPIGPAKGKGKKEKKAAEEARDKALSECQAVVFLEHIRAMHVELRYAGNFLHSHFSQMMGSDEDFVPATVGEDLGKAQSALEQMRPSVDSRIQRSFLHAFEDMHTTIKSRF